ncbi:hypothetical protein BH20ACI1_BH20ACI1_03940 [soil metagenome]
MIETTQKVPLTVWKDGTIRVGETRLPIDRIIYAHKNGECPEEIFDSFPSTQYTIADIYSIIAYYLKNKEEIEIYLEKREREAKKIKEEIESMPGYRDKRDKLKQKVLDKWREIEK